MAYFPIWACSWWRRLATGMPTSSGSMTCCPSRSRRKTHCQKTGRSSPSSSTSRDTTPTSTKRHTTRKCSMRWGFTVRLGYYSSQHAQARNKKMLIEVGFHSQTGLLLQSACTGTQQENAHWGGVSQSDWVTTPISMHRHTIRKCSMRWGFTVRLGYYSNQHAQAHNKKMLNEMGFHSQTGILLQPACTGTQPENAQWGGIWQTGCTISMHRHTTRKCSVR